MDVAKRKVIIKLQKIIMHLLMSIGNNGGLIMTEQKIRERCMDCGFISGLLALIGITTLFHIKLYILGIIILLLAMSGISYGVYLTRKDADEE